MRSQSLIDIFSFSAYNNSSRQGMPTAKILFAHRWRLISDRLENIVRLPEASNKCPVRKFEAPS